MSDAVVYLDESGDLGWKFDQPYRSGGSSRYLTIVAVVTPSQKSHLPGRSVKKIYQKYKWNPTEEKKWSMLKEPEKNLVLEKCISLASQHTDIKFFSITVYKPNVESHIRADANKLYNYMIKLILLDELARFENVRFIPDPRSIKIKSGNSLADYLQTALWFEKSVKTKLINSPLDSASCKGLQFTDMISGIVQQHFEDSKDNHKERWGKLTSHLTCKQLYFPKN
ncbi:MAG TPA: DUF3800 domain-containing protein [Candidatus Saccharimonadales bacterium]|nr:DUF3800 domain-containing protein [Candidatus Saccharimonadales bacterium]